MKTLLWTSVLAFSFGSTYAQEKKKGELFQVTGSRIKRKDLDVSSPITVLSQEAIEATGSETVTEILKTIPSIVGNTVGTSTTSGGQGGAGNVTLRGLAATSTLVLLNGKRLPNDGVDGETPDLNVIPSSAIERIEVLKDGASAIYGSDAIAGVINIITKSNYSGMESKIYLGQASRGDLETTSVTTLYGSSGDKGNIMVGLNFYKQGSVSSRDRDVSKVTLNPSSSFPGGSATITTGTGFSCSNDASSCRVTANDGVTNPSSVSDFRQITSSDSYNYNQVTDSIMAQERKSLFFNAEYDVTNSTQLKLSSFYSNNLSTYHSAPTPIFTAFETGDLVLSSSNSENPFNENVSDVRRRMTELGPRRHEFNTNVYNAVLDLEGDIGSSGWTWNSFYNYGHTDTLETTFNLLNKTHLAASIGPDTVCDNLSNLGCERIDLLAAEGTYTSSQLDWLRSNSTKLGLFDTETIGLGATGDLMELGGGTASIAAGIEFRTERFKRTPSGESQSYNTIGSTNTKETSGNREVGVFYMEGLLPVHKMLTLELAARHEQYDDFGSATKPKLGFKFQATDSILLRGTYSTGFRAPSLLELYKGQAESFLFLTDLCASDASLCNGGAQSDSAVFQTPALLGGNKDLEAEESKSFTAGLAITAPYGIIAKFDYFNIVTDNAISTNAQYVLDEYRRNGNFADKVDTDANNNVTSIRAVALNLSSREVQGLDFGLGIRQQLENSNSWGVELAGTYFIEYKDQASKDSDFEDIVGKYVDKSSDGQGSIPRFKANLSWSMGLGAADIVLTQNYISELEASNGDTLDAWHTIDINARYHIESIGTVMLGVDNVTDEEPPSTSAAVNDNIDGRTHSLIGTYAYTGITSEF